MEGRLPLRSRGKLARRKRNVVGAIGPPRDLNLMVQLAAEYSQFSDDLLSQFGLDEVCIDRAQKLAAGHKRIRASDQVLERIHALSRVLSAWQKDKRYQGAEGPRVLPIRGKTPSFQSLMKEMAPGIEVEDALQTLLSQSDVRLVRANKVSLLGSTTVLFPKSPEVIFSAFLMHFRRFSETGFKNALIPPGVKGQWYYAREVTARMTRSEAEKFLRSFRVSLDDLIEHMQGQTEDRPHTRDGKHNCGLSVFLWEE